MPRPKKTPAQLDATRERILDIALDLLQASGPEAITSRAIAEQLGMAHMSLYTYFENQAAILRALGQRERTKWRAKQQAFEQRAQTEDITLVVEDLLKFIGAFARKNPNLFRMAWVMPEAAGESPAESRQRMQATVGHLAQLLQVGMQRGVFEPRDPSLAAGTVLAMINTPYILFYSGKISDPALRDRMAEEMLTAARLYLQARS